MANLFEISEKYQAIINELEDSGGELTEELAARLDVSKEELEEKIKAYYHIIKLREAEIDLSKAEKERLNGRQKAKENAIKRLKNAVGIAVELFGEITPKKKSKSLSFTNLSVWLKETETLEIVDETKIPDIYKTCSIGINLTKKQEVIKILEAANIAFTFSPQYTISKEAIREQLSIEKEYTDIERQERIDAGEKLIEGVAIVVNKTPIFN